MVGGRIIIIMMAAPAWAVPSGWLVFRILKPGRLMFDEWVKCVSEIRAIYILLFCRMASNSFLRFIRPFEFYVRMRMDFEVILLVGIFIRDEAWNKSDEKRDERVYDCEF